MANHMLAGRIEVASLRLTEEGGIEIVGARVIDPDGDVVLTLERMRVHLELRGLRSRAIGLRVELDSPALALKREEDGSLSIGRAFAPAHPSPEKPGKPRASRWTVSLRRLTLRNGSARYVDAQGRTRFWAQGLDADGRAIYAPARSGIDLSLRGEMISPERAPLSLEALAVLRGNELRVRRLRLAVGETAVDLAGEGDLARRLGRAAIVFSTANADALRGLAPGQPFAGELGGTLYLEARSREATAALDLAPKRGGKATAAAALWLPPREMAMGGQVRLEGLDLSRILRGAPKSSITLEARGRAIGKNLATLRGSLALSLLPSRLRVGRAGPIELAVTADRGVFEVARCAASLPGATLSLRGRWRLGGEMAGEAVLGLTDLAMAQKNAESLLAHPLPPMTGMARVEATLSGTERAPTALLRATSSQLSVASMSATGVSLSVNLTGPLAAPNAQLTGAIDRLFTSNLDARNLALRAQFAQRAGEVTATGSVPLLGKEPILLRLAGALNPDNRSLLLSGLTLAWPGDRFELEQPARVNLAGPSVDRLSLAAGAQRLFVAGGAAGQGRRRVLDVHAKIEELDLARLPRALLAPQLGLAGIVSAEATARGALDGPRLTLTAAIANGAVSGLDGLSANVGLRYDGGMRRARVHLGLRRAAGGELAVRGDLPVPPARAAGREPIEASVVLRNFPLAEAVRLADVDPGADLEGQTELEIEAAGTVAAPTFTASASVSNARYGDLEALALRARLNARGEQAQLTASLEGEGARALELEASMKLACALLLRDPARAVHRLLAERFAASALVPGFELGLVAGRMGLPEDLRGTLSARADLSGTPSAPRGKMTVGLSGVTYAGYRDLSLEAALWAREDATSAEGRTALGGRDLAVLTARVGLPAERLFTQAAREAAPVAMRLDVPHADLEKAGAPAALAGELVGHLDLTGSLAALRLDAELQGARLAVNGRPLGNLAAMARAGERSLRFQIHLAVAGGGALDAALSADIPLSLSALRGEMKSAPARARLVAKDMDLGFLPAVAPGVLRSAAGKLNADVAAKGSLGHLNPRGTVVLDGGKASVVEFGDFTDIGLQASLSEDLCRIDRLSAKHGRGTLEFVAEAKGLARQGAPADVHAELRTKELTVSRAGQPLGTVDLLAKLNGTASSDSLDAVLTIPQARVKLPDQSPRKIQPLGEHPDIVVGPFGKKNVASSVVPSDYRARLHLVVPNRFFVKGDNPVLDLELKADVTATYEQEDLALNGSVETVRGRVEPVGGRSFAVQRARVHFTGQSYSAATLDVLATYQDPQGIEVTVAVGGTVEKPEFKLTSDPPLPGGEAQIALLIATGHTDLKAGTGGVSADEQTAAMGAAGALVGVLFKDIVADKLPVDTVSLDSSQLRAGKYVTDKIYVGYTRRIFTPTGQGENTNEVEAQYRISPRWNFEMRYGDAQTGGASLIWSKDY